MTKLWLINLVMYIMSGLLNLLFVLIMLMCMQWLYWANDMSMLSFSKNFLFKSLVFSSIFFFLASVYLFAIKYSWRLKAWAMLPCMFDIFGKWFAPYMGVFLISDMLLDACFAMIMWWGVVFFIQGFSILETEKECTKWELTKFFFEVFLFFIFYFLVVLVYCAFFVNF